MTRERDERFNERLREVESFEGELPGFDPGAAPEHPAELFMEWLEAAIDAGVREPHVMSLATVDADGRPSSRSLILRGLDAGRWSFGTSRTSRKGAELAATPWAAATFYWSPLGRQVRLRGRVLDAGPEAAAEDFLGRPQGARVAALASRQSEPLASPSDLEDALAEAQRRVDPTRGRSPSTGPSFISCPTRPSSSRPTTSAATSACATCCATDAGSAIDCGHRRDRRRGVTSRQEDL